VSGRPRRETRSGSRGCAGSEERASQGAPERRQRTPPNVLADTTRPNLLSPAAALPKPARKASPGIGWAPPPPPAAPDPAADARPARAASDAPPGLVPDGAAATGGGGRGCGAAAGQGAGEAGAERAEAAVGDAGRTPHPAGRAVPPGAPSLRLTCLALRGGRPARGALALDGAGSCRGARVESLQPGLYALAF